VASRPDLVLFMTDQQRYDQVGYASSGHFETPNLDLLASQGVVFDAAYSTSTTCVPARVGLLTGLLHHRVPTQVNGLALQEGFWTIAHALRTAGYETALFGKMHFFPVRSRHGFDTMRTVEHLTNDRVVRGERDDYHDWLAAQSIDDWRGAFSQDRHASAGPFPYDASMHPTGWIEHEVVSFLRTRDSRRPLLLIVSFPHPHAPYNPPEPYANMYDPSDSLLPRDTSDANAALPVEFQNAFRKFGGRVPPRVDPGNPKVLQTFLATIRALMRQIDDSIGKILDELDLTRSVVFFTSDHGDYAGHRGVLRKAPWIPFDDLARVPLVVAGIGVAGSRRVATLVQSSDFVPTCLEYAGVEIAQEGLDAWSLRPLLDDPTAAHENRAVISATTMGWPMVRRGPLKYIWHKGTWAHVLFDLEDDPGETISLHEDPTYQSARRDLGRLLDTSLMQGTPNLPRFP
jgi:arylsulfatase